VGLLRRGIGMVIGLIIYLIALRTLPKIASHGCRANRGEEAADRQGLEAVIAIVLLCIPTRPVLGRLRAAGQHH